jgi:hypothetical protein
MELITHLDLCAASGLVHQSGFLYCVADDGLELLRTGVNGAMPHRLALSEAPQRSHIAKKEKPDFEALLLNAGEIIAFGSGSTALRCRAIAINPESLATRSIDLRPLYDALGVRIHELNIEGAVVRNDEVILGQRGNGAKKENALVRLDRARFEQDLARNVITAECLKTITPLELGDFNGVPLSLTDLALGAGEQLIFTAAAEDTDNPYDDGVVAGSVVGVIDGSARQVVSLPGVKLEGVCWIPSSELRLVADPDDPDARAPLYRLEW